MKQTKMTFHIQFSKETLMFPFSNKSTTYIVETFDIYMLDCKLVFS